MNPALPFPPNQSLPSDVMINPYHSTVWGPQLWRFLHTVAGQYPDIPTSQEKASCRQLLYSLRHLLPCPKCRVHFTKAITQRAPDVSSGAALQRWLVGFHNDVNRRLGKPCDWTYEQVRAMYPPPSELETVASDYAGQPNDDDELPIGGGGGGSSESNEQKIEFPPLFQRPPQQPPTPPTLNLPSPLLKPESVSIAQSKSTPRMPFRKQRMPSPRLARRAANRAVSPRRKLPTPRARARSLSPRMIQQRTQQIRKRINVTPQTTSQSFSALIEKAKGIGSGKLGLLPRTKVGSPPPPAKPCKNCGKH